MSNVYNIYNICDIYGLLESTCTRLEILLAHLVSRQIIEASAHQMVNVSNTASLAPQLHVALAAALATPPKRFPRVLDTLRVVLSIDTDFFKFHLHFTSDFHY